MNIQEFKIHTNGSEIYGAHVCPQSIKGVVVLVHGFGEHSGRYLHNVMPMLMKNGFAVVTYDNVGHGKSSGKRGHCQSYEALLDILNTIIDRAIGYYPNLPLLLYGHSMGGNLVLNYALRRENNITAIIATSPYLRLAFQPPKWKLLIGKWMLNRLPSITMPSGLDPNGISRIPEEIEKYKKDPLVHDRVSPMFSFPIMHAGEWAISNADRLEINTLLIHGTADPIIEFKGTKEFHEHSKRTSLALIEGGYHELHHDLDQQKVFQVMTTWLDDQIL